MAPTDPFYLVRDDIQSSVTSVAGCPHAYWLPEDLHLVLKRFPKLLFQKNLQQLQPFPASSYLVHDTWCALHRWIRPRHSSQDGGARIKRALSGKSWKSRLRMSARALLGR